MNNSNIDSQAERIFSYEASVDKSPSSYGSVGWNKFGFTNSPLTTNFPFFEVIKNVLFIVINPLFEIRGCITFDVQRS